MKERLKVTQLQPGAEHLSPQRRRRSSTMAPSKPTVLVLGAYADAHYRSTGADAAQAGGRKVSLGRSCTTSSREMKSASISAQQLPH